MKKIIVPIDFSEHSSHALHAASLMAKKNDSEIIAVHMLELSEALINKSTAEQQVEAIYFLRLAEQKFEDFLNQDYLAGVKVTPVVKHFKVFAELNDIAKEHDADLVIMGSHGATGAKEFFVGSNTEKVVRNSEVPVLVIKNPIESLEVNTVVFACSLKEETIPAFNKAKQMFNAIGAKLQVLYVNLPNEHFLSTHEINALSQDFLSKIDGELDLPVAYYSDYTVEEGILNYANSINADVIALPTHGRQGLMHFFNGSIGEDVANHAKRPVVTFKI